MSQRILIVDDDPIILRFAAAHLRGAGYQVVTTTNPLLMAMELGAHQPDLVLLDVEMPAIRGTQVLGALRRSSCHDAVKIVLFSSLADTVLDQLSREFAATGFIRKASPLDGPGLIEQVANFLADVPASCRPLALVADDSRSMRRLLTGVLTSFGMNVVHAANAEEVAAVLEREENVRLALVDVNMPGAEGATLVELLRRHEAARQAKILLVTCETDPALIKLVRAAGADGYLPKPFTRGELTSAVARLVENEHAAG